MDKLTLSSMRLASIFVLLYFFLSCTYEKGPMPTSSSKDQACYPEEVNKIIVSKCAVSGCHNNTSYLVAAGLNLSSWQKMYEGSYSGPVVIPGSPDLSTMILYCNSYPDLGVVLEPRMPYNGEYLSRGEMKTLTDWVAQGALNCQGQSMFPEDPYRSKIYITNQGCDLVYVIDAESKKVIKAVSVGNDVNTIESPHMLRVSPDGQFWYVAFLNKALLQKYSTSTDALLGQYNLPDPGGLWGTFAISPDSKYGFAVDWVNPGLISIIDLAKMSLVINYNGHPFPHGACVSMDGKTLFVTNQTSNYIYKFDITKLDRERMTEVVLQATPAQPLNTSILDPHEIIISPDDSKYFVTCQRTNEVRVMKRSNDSLLQVIKVGITPQELSISPSRNLLFVSCMEDTIGVPEGTRGSIAVIDMSSLTLVKKITGFNQPHGVAVDEKRNKVYVASRNTNPNGPAPHHSTHCGGRNGYFQQIDLTTLELLDGRMEVATDPYFIDVRE